MTQAGLSRAGRGQAFLPEPWRRAPRRTAMPNPRGDWPLAGVRADAKRQGWEGQAVKPSAGEASQTVCEH